MFTCIDLVGAYKLSPDKKKRAVEVRAKLAEDEFKKDSESRKEAIQMKKQEKLLAERVRRSRQCCCHVNGCMGVSGCAASVAGGFGIVFCKCGWVARTVRVS